MSSHIFSNLQRTKEDMTCGITNIPLTKPAKIQFIADLHNDSHIDNIYSFYESINAEIVRHDNYIAHKCIFTTIEDIDYKTVKLTWRNFKSLHPKFNTQWRYLFWEIDEHSEELLTQVVSVYTDLKLPLFIHRTMRGYHFFSVVPILEDNWLNAVKRLRGTNTKYPPITLRVNANKWIGELDRYKEGFIISTKHHSDTMRLRDMIYHQDFIKLGEQYQLVWYPIDNKLNEGDYTP